jgi:hypothetical protein
MMLFQLIYKLDNVLLFPMSLYQKGMTHSQWCATVAMAISRLHPTTGLFFISIYLAQYLSRKYRQSAPSINADCHKQIKNANHLSRKNVPDCEVRIEPVLKYDIVDGQGTMSPEPVRIFRWLFIHTCILSKYPSLFALRAALLIRLRTTTG